ncbi:MAG: hypothetical protein J07HQW2_01046 [Haloquadratum walsbyi J07HQW2]|jgi:hypothetical protein|uniref:Uncharacterized protein n=1 Tax=Haloquadratum walsbyi J07HQW2 TaxID=1238425 RepID=U1NCF5_9EURY|nr:MAG: hypothetical protein J07HQW2_01046 [Haloquadratum walsbyi J07HQW2]
MKGSVSLSNITAASSVGKTSSMNMCIHADTDTIQPNTSIILAIIEIHALDMGGENTMTVTHGQMHD